MVYKHLGEQRASLRIIGADHGFPQIKSNISSFGEVGSGELFALDYNGKIYKFDP